MDSDLTMTIWFAAARAVHFAACLLLLGVWTFDRLVITAVPRARRLIVTGFWRDIERYLILMALPAALLSGAAWLALVASAMSGLPLRQALHLHVLHMVWSRTRFGVVWQWRSIFWLSAAITGTWVLALARESRLKATLIWLATLFGALLVGSLAWSGHGGNGEPPQWHLLADVVHLIVSAAWPVGLLPLLLIFLGARKIPSADRAFALSRIISRFSAISLPCVVILAASGSVNSWYMLSSISDLVRTTYGRVLLLKIALFGLMVALGAANRYVLVPRLAAQTALDPNNVSKMQFRGAVALELFVGILVVVAVGLLGTLPPPTM